MDDFENELREALEDPGLPDEDQWGAVAPGTVEVTNEISRILEYNKGIWHINGRDYEVRDIYTDEFTDGAFVERVEIVVQLVSANEVFEYRLKTSGTE